MRLAPWRVIISQVGIIAALIVLVATVGGSLKDEFSIPGSDTQRATDLIESEFAEEQGGVLSLVFAAPEGERLDTPERKAAVEAAIASSRRTSSPRRDGSRGRRRHHDVGDPFDKNTFSDDGRIAYAERGSTVSSTRRIASASWMWRTQCVTRSSRRA